MTLGYLALLVAEIPLWIKHMATDGEIDFVTFKHVSPKTSFELVAHFEDNMKAAREALQAATDESLESTFTLKANGQVLYSSKKINDIIINVALIKVIFLSENSSQKLNIAIKRDIIILLILFFEN